ncbi:Hypothetical predicted protein [Mytilus galloprovincialis]|uniref:Uncharacterized protein n=1 Tax=Mytilus galloprovincialis TaxID=29158 RepID=A0A8B6D5N2_MYTGA|nr:Hypothetical predicted protein [Mytilus galloprovincialis]
MSDCEESYARESFRTVPTGGDILGYRDNQGFSQGSYGMTNDYGDNYRGDNTVTRGNNSHNKSYSSNKKPATFDGTSSWQDYLVHFEMVAEINGWDNISKALELATCLRGSAQAILSDLRPDLRRSFTHLVTALASRFQPSNQAELYRAQMKSTTREKNQSLPELAQDIKKLTRLAYPTAPMEVREQLARDCFIDSLNDADLEWAIFQGKPISIDDSVRIGLEFEAFANGHRRKFNNRAGLRMQTGMIDVDEQDDYQQMNSIMDRIAKIESNRGPNQSQKTDFLCYFCGKAGHFKRDCRKFLDMQKNGKYLPNNRFETSKWSQGTQTENFKSGNYTGSTLTVIHVRKFLSIPESQRPDRIYKGVQLKLANGEIITTFGQADFDIEINGQKFQQRFVIADIDAPAIVGYNFLYNKDCKLDIRESKLTIGSKNMEIICQKESNMVNIFKLATEETTVIPPRSEVLVFSKVVGDSTHLVQATVEPVDTKDKLLVARSLVDPSQGRIILRIANTSNFEKTVQKNTCLAECQAYADVTEPACETAAASQNIFKLTDKITNNGNSDSLPDHLVDLFKSGSKLLSETQTLQFQRLLQKHSNAFAKSKNDLGCTDMIQHKITQETQAPVKQNPRRLPVTMQEEADRELSRMLDAGDSKESTINDLDTVDCHLRVTKKADKLQGEEIEFENSEQSNQWIQSKNMDEITEAQQNDEVIKLILKMKSESNEKPKWEEISVQSKELKTYWSQWDQLKLINNVLYREWISNINSEMKQLILPSCWREEILKMLHDDPVGGHFGVHRTLSRVSSRFYWAGYKENIEQWCKRCEICNSRKGPQKRARGAMKQYLVGAPLERVALDILGPLPITTSGNKFILVLTDYFSRWAEAYPIPNQEAETISKIFVDEFICRFGVPRQVHTDQGRQFESKLFTGICKRFNIDKTRTSPYIHKVTGWWSDSIEL